MNLFNFGREQLQKGMLNNMLEQVGIDDVGSFVSEFRQEAEQEAQAAHRSQSDDEGEDEDTSLRHASGQQANFMSMGKSFLNQVRYSLHNQCSPKLDDSSEEVVVVVEIQPI